MLTIYSPPNQPSSTDLRLIALMKRDRDVLRAREIADKPPAPGRSPATRAKISAAMRGKTNRKLKAAVPPAILTGRKRYA
jgi:hypothetical protein